MDMNGVAVTIRLSPCAEAWRNAKPKADRVFPPPVGTVSRNTPGGLSAAARQSSYTSDRTALTAPEAPLTLSRWRGWNRSQSWAISGSELRTAARPGLKCRSVSRKSASTKAEKTIRSHSSALDRIALHEVRNVHRMMGFQFRNQPAGCFQRLGCGSGCSLLGCPSFQFLHRPEPAVMSLYQQSTRTQVLTGQPGPGSLVVGTSRFVAGEVPLKFRIEFAQVVPEPGVVGGLATAEGTAELPGQFGHCPEVFHQAVPLTFLVGRVRMVVRHRQLPENVYVASSWSGGALGQEMGAVAQRRHRFPWTKPVDSPHVAVQGKCPVKCSA